MHHAVRIKLENPELSLPDVLRMAGFVFTNQDKRRGPKVGPDGVTILQRKNQLCRRLRDERKRRDKERQERRHPKQQKPELMPAPGTSVKMGRPQHSFVPRGLRPAHQKVNANTTPTNEYDSAAALITKTPDMPTQVQRAPLAVTSTSHDVAKELSNNKNADPMGDFELNEEGVGLGLDFAHETFTVHPASCPVFTEEEIEREETEMTAEERAASIADRHGKGPANEWHRIMECMSSGVASLGISDATLPNPIKVLLAEVRAEVEAIQRGEGDVPAVEGDLASAVRSETDDRLELFLLREKMDAKSAATRLVKYWRKRFELFGADKFNLPMALNGVLHGDDANVALATGTVRILPDLDAHGRKIMFRANCYHTQKGYSTSSMIRAWWYMFEALLEDPNTRKGVVLIVWGLHTTLWNYDRRVDSAIAEFERDFLPLQFCAIHICRTDSLLVKLLKPVAYACMDRRIRSRTYWQLDPGDKLFDALEFSGISRDVLPLEMGGRSNFSHSNWLQEQRAAGK